MNLYIARVVLLLTLVVVSAGCGGSGTAASATTEIAAVLTDTAIQLDHTTAAPGVVTFKAHNAGTVAHSLLLIKTDVAPDKLTPDPKDASRADRTGEVRETAQIAIGQDASFSAQLTAGNYVLICNEPGHYLIGMRVPFSVK